MGSGRSARGSKARRGPGGGRRRARREGRYLNVARYRLLLALAERTEQRLLAEAGAYGEKVPIPRGASVEEDLALFRVRLEHHGESFDNILKVRHLARRHPDLALFVQASPAFCCPSLVTEAMACRIEEATGVPVVTVTYDGTGTFQNDRIAPYLAEASRLRSGQRLRQGASFHDGCQAPIE